MHHYFSRFYVARIPSMSIARERGNAIYRFSFRNACIEELLAVAGAVRENFRFTIHPS